MLGRLIKGIWAARRAPAKVAGLMQEAVRHRQAGDLAAAQSLCHRILGDRHEAEDVAQEAFVIAYRSLSTWRGEGPFGAWITRIAVRDAIRRAGRRREGS